MGSAGSELQGSSLDSRRDKCLSSTVTKHTFNHKQEIRTTYVDNDFLRSSSPCCHHHPSMLLMPGILPFSQSQPAVWVWETTVPTSSGGPSPPMFTQIIHSVMQAQLLVSLLWVKRTEPEAGEASLRPLALTHGLSSEPDPYWGRNNRSSRQMWDCLFFFSIH